MAYALDLKLEKRLSPRRNTLIAAQIAFAGQSRDCVIRNVSDTGAKIETLGVGQIPQHFELHTPGHQPQTCRVVWRAMREMGVQFVTPSNA